MLDRCRWTGRLVHVAGGAEHGGLYHDTHTDPTPPEVLALVAALCERHTPPALMLERDGHYPPAPELARELDAIADAAGSPASRRRPCAVDRGVVVSRADLAARQEALVAALVRGGPMPPGFAARPDARRASPSSRSGPVRSPGVAAARRARSTVVGGRAPPRRRPTAGGDPRRLGHRPCPAEPVRAAALELATARPRGSTTARAPRDGGARRTCAVPVGRRRAGRRAGRQLAVALKIIASGARWPWISDWRAAPTSSLAHHAASATPPPSASSPTARTVVTSARTRTRPHGEPHRAGQRRRGRRRPGRPGTPQRLIDQARSRTAESTAR